MRKERNVGFLRLEGGTTETEHAFSFALGKLAEIEGFGYREADRVHPPHPLACPPPPPALMKTVIQQSPEAGTYKHGPP